MEFSFRFLYLKMYFLNCKIGEFLLFRNFIIEFISVKVDIVYALAFQTKRYKF